MIDRIKHELKNGGAVVLPTETVYGLFAKALDEKVFLDNSDLFYMLMSNNPDFIVFLKNNIEEIQPNDYNSEKDIYRNLTNTYGDFFITRTTLLAIIGDFEEVEKRRKKYGRKNSKNRYI